MIEIERLDHLVLTVRNAQVTCAFYSTVLGMEAVVFQGDRLALKFGYQKINLHEYGRSPAPHAHEPTPGSGDLCFITTTPLADVIAHLNICQVPIEAGIVPRTGAEGPIASIYIRDPDGNLIELANRIATVP